MHTIFFGLLFEDFLAEEDLEEPLAPPDGDLAEVEVGVETPLPWPEMGVVSGEGCTRWEVLESVIPPAPDTWGPDDSDTVQRKSDL